MALAMALECEEEISGLVLLAPAAYSSGSSNWWTPLAHVPWLGPLCIKTLTRVIGRHLIKESLRSAYHPQDIQTEYLKTAELLWLRPEQVKACADDDRSLNESLDRLRHRYPKIQLPVVIVTGDSDLLVKPEEHAERLHRTISGSRLIRLTETGHQILHTRPEAVCEAIKTAMRLVDSR